MGQTPSDEDMAVMFLGESNHTPPRLSTNIFHNNKYRKTFPPTSLTYFMTHLKFPHYTFDAQELDHDNSGGIDFEEVLSPLPSMFLSPDYSPSDLIHWGYAITLTGHSLQLHTCLHA